MDKIKVELYDIRGPVVIVPAETGVIYCNQTDGVCCNHPEVEGYIIPLPAQIVPGDVFDPEWWYLAPFHPNDEEIRQKIEDSINTSRPWCIENLSVIVHPENEEAWVHVEFDSVRYNFNGNTGHFPKVLIRMRGILTWPNSD